jgi:hypothetical protein
LEEIEMKKVLFLLFAIAVSGCASSKPLAYSWDEKVEMRLKAMGERNWIVIAESGYPLVTDSAYRTVNSDEDLLYLVKYLLGEIADSPHVKAVVYREKELERIQERDAPGVDAFRGKFAKLTQQAEVQAVPRADARKLVAEAAKNHQVLVLKSEGVMPYSTVYVKLASGYWDEGREKRLREAITMAR